MRAGPRRDRRSIASRERASRGRASHGRASRGRAKRERAKRGRVEPRTRQPRTREPRTRETRARRPRTRKPRAREPWTREPRSGVRVEPTAPTLQMPNRGPQSVERDRPRQRAPSLSLLELKSKDNSMERHPLLRKRRKWFVGARTYGFSRGNAGRRPKPQRGGSAPLSGLCRLSRACRGRPSPPRASAVGLILPPFQGLRRARTAGYHPHRPPSRNCHGPVTPEFGAARLPRSERRRRMPRLRQDSIE